MKKELTLRLQERVHDHQFLLALNKNWTRDEADHCVNQLRNNVRTAMVCGGYGG
jgi:hypothetical protein